MTQQESLNKRNIEGLAEAFKIERDKNIKLNNDLIGLKNHLSTIMRDIVDLKQQLALSKAMIAGHGPTSL